MESDKDQIMNNSSDSVLSYLGGPDHEPIKIIKEKSKNSLSFNVMPNRVVKEDLLISEYKIWDNAIEVTFDRDYYSEMEESPNHLIFLSSLIHFQKLVYVFFCHKLNYKYDPYGPELLKVWPTRTDCKIPKLIRNTKAIKQILFFESIEKKSETTYFAKATTIINNSMVIYGEALIIVLEKK